MLAASRSSQVWADSRPAVGTMSAIGGNQEVPRTGEWGVEWGLYNSRQTEGWGEGVQIRSRVLPVQTAGFMSLGAKYFWLSGVTLAPHLPQKSSLLPRRPVCVIIFVAILRLNDPIIFARFSILKTIEGERRNSF